MEKTSPVELKPDVLTPLWSVPQRTVAELTTNVAGVALATPTETREALARPRALVPQAVLCSVDETKTGVGMDVPVTTANGKPDTRWRFLFQTGTGEVLCDKSSLLVGGRCANKTVKTVVNLKKGVVPDETWNRAIAIDPEQVAREWLLAQGLKCLEVQRPRA